MACNSLLFQHFVFLGGSRQSRLEGDKQGLVSSAIEYRDSRTSLDMDRRRGNHGRKRSGRGNADSELELADD